MQATSVERPDSSSSAEGPLASRQPNTNEVAPDPAPAVALALASAAAPVASPSVWNLTSAKRPQASSEPATVSRGLPGTRGVSNAARGRVATRGGGNIAIKNVFQAREPPKKRGNLLKNAMDAAKAPKKFSNMRLARKAELQARDLAESAPDISALGGLFDPSRPDSMIPIRPEKLRKTSSSMVPMDDPNPLFVNSRESSPVLGDPWDVNSRQQPHPERGLPPTKGPPGVSTCYYWNKHQKDNNQPPCQMGTACRFLHRYAEGVPIAPAPNNLGVDSRRASTEDAMDSSPIVPTERKLPAGPQQSTCFFWDRAMKDGNESGCSRGDSCTYMHRYEEGAPIAPPPPGYVIVDKRKPNTSDQGAYSQPHVPPLERNLPILEGATCYYWDRAQRDITKAPCSQGESCTYLHKYEVGVPVAPPPPPSFSPDESTHYPSTSDFPPWHEHSSENDNQEVTHPQWRRDSGETLHAELAQESLSGQIPDLNTVLQNLRMATDSPRDPSHKTRPESPLKKVSTPDSEAASRPPWDPYNPTRAICHFHFTNGTCSKGSRCKYIHSLQPSLPVAPSIYEQSQIFARTPCLDFQNGHCKYSATSDCRLSHEIQMPQKKTYETRDDQASRVREEGSSYRPSSVSQSEPAKKAVSELQTKPKDSKSSVRGPAGEYFETAANSTGLRTRPRWNPFDPYNSICHFWHMKGECSRGNSCTFCHSSDPNLPIAPPPSEQASLRAAALREEAARSQEAAKGYASAGHSYAMPDREKSSKKDVDEARNGRSSSISADPSPPRKALVLRAEPTAEPQNNAAVEAERQLGADISRPSGQKPSVQSPLQASSTSSVPNIKRRPAWNPRDPLNAICFFLASTGSCPEGRSCQYIHSNDASLAVAPSPLEIEGRPEWNPLSPLDSICYFLATVGSCSWGSKCKYIHSNDPTLPVAPSPAEQKAIRERGPTCKYWLRDECRDSAQVCRWWHGPESAKQKSGSASYDRYREHDIYPPVRSPSPAVNKMSGRSERDPRGRETCRNWLKNDCRYTNDTCRDWHGPWSAKEEYDLQAKGRPREQLSSPTKLFPPGPRVKSVSFAIDDDVPLVEEPENISSSNRSVQRPRPADSSSNPSLDEYKSKNGICFHWSEGTCYHGAECWYRHEYALGEGPRQSSRDILMGERVEKQSLIPARRSEGHRDVEMRDQVEGKQVQGPIRQSESRRDIEMRDADEIARTAKPSKPSVTFDPMTNSPALALSQNELPSDYAEAKFAAQPIPTASELLAQSPNAFLDDPIVSPRTHSKLDMDGYRHRRTKATKELGARVKEVTFGRDETQSFWLDFGDMSQAFELPWGPSFSSVNKVRFNQICIAQDFQAQQGCLERLRLWHGNLVPADIADAVAVKAVEKAADELIRRSAGLFSRFSDFILLVFPAKKDEWKFLESTLDYAQDARLRYFIFQSHVDIRHSLKMNQTTLAVSAPHRDILIDRVYGLDYKKLLPVIRKQKPPYFFLLFPTTSSQAADFIVLWLRSSNRSCKIYSSQSEGSWLYFIDNPDIHDGIVLVHESAAAEIHRLPNLYSAVVKKNFTFWYLSESSSPYPLFPSTSYDFDDSTMGQLSAVRLFPHGCAFLLTPSFLLAEPHNVYQILKWFITGTGGKPAKYLVSTPRTWKLVCCHGFSDYVLDLAISKADERDALESKHKDDPAKDAILDDAGLSWAECNNRFRVHTLLVEFDMKRSLESYDSDSENADYPFIHASKHIDLDDEKGLIDWYAGWTMRNLDMYKKFIVVGSSEMKYKGNFNARFRRTKGVVVERRKIIPAADSPKRPLSNFRSLSMNQQPSASPMESPQSPMSAQKRRALEIAAKLSASPVAANSSRDVDRSPFDSTPSGAAASPIGQSRRSSALANAQSPHDADDTREIATQIMDLIAEESSRNPSPLNTPETPHNNGSLANPAPNSDSTNGLRTLPLPSIFDGADNQPVNMDTDTPMLGFDGTGDERPTSSSSNTSRSGIQSDENGCRFVPRSVRPNASIRPEISVRQGYIPPEDKDVYQIPSRRGSAAGTPTNQSGLASPARASSANMDIDSDRERDRGLQKSGWAEAEPRPVSAQSQTLSEREDGEVEEVKKELKEVKFEATTTWYKRVQKEGGGWEHIRVEGFEAARGSLGMGK